MRNHTHSLKRSLALREFALGIEALGVADLANERGLGKPVRCGGSLRCRNWRGFPHKQLVQDKYETEK